MLPEPGHELQISCFPCRYASTRLKFPFFCGFPLSSWQSSCLYLYVDELNTIILIIWKPRWRSANSTMCIYTLFWVTGLICQLITMMYFSGGPSSRKGILWPVVITEECAWHIRFSPKFYSIDLFYMLRMLLGDTSVVSRRNDLQLTRYLIYGNYLKTHWILGGDTQPFNWF